VHTIMSNKHVASSKTRHLAPAEEKFPSALDTKFLLYVALSGRYMASGDSPKRAKFT
jgi:hypothetical protein